MARVDKRIPALGKEEAVPRGSRGSWCLRRDLAFVVCSGKRDGVGWRVDHYTRGGSADGLVERDHGVIVADVGARDEIVVAVLVKGDDWIGG